MKNLYKYIRNWVQDMGEIITLEFRALITNSGALIIMLGGTLIYGLLYNYMYEPNVIHNIPIAIVDESRTATSREFSRMLNSTNKVKVITNDVNFEQAKELIKSQDIKGFVYFSRDFEEKIAQGEQTTVSVYATTYAFLYYGSISKAVANCALAIGDKIKAEKIGSIKTPKQSILAQVKGINVVGTAVFNHTEGYGDYLVPQVMLLVLYQTLIIGIGILAATQREKNKGELLSRKATNKRGVLRIVLGKSICYLIVYGIISLFLMGFAPLLFDLPNRASGLEIAAFMIPFLLATTFIGICLSVLFHSEESPLLLIVFSSIPLLFLAGTSYPFELLPWYWRIFHYIIPAPLATMAFVKLNSMGAEFSQIKMEYLTLWIQTFVYFVLALFAYSYNIKQIKKANTMKTTNSQKTNT